MRRARLAGPLGNLEQGCAASPPVIGYALPPCLMLPAPPAKLLRNWAWTEGTAASDSCFSNRRDWKPEVI